MSRNPMAAEGRFVRAEGRFWRSAFAMPHVKPSRWLALFSALWLVVALVTSPALMADRARAAAGGGAGGAQFHVSSFTAPNTNGAQAITGVGFTPKAILFWGSGSDAASGTWDANVQQTIGFTSGPTESYSFAGASQDGVGTSNTTRRIAAKAITITAHGEQTVAEANLTSFNADGFTITWTQSFTNDDVICFMAIGGSGVQAKVVIWTSPTATGNKAVTGVGFQPDAVLHVGGAVLGAPNSFTSHYLGFGAMDSAGGQWANAVFAQDNTSPSDTARYQRTNKAIAVNGASLVVEEASFVSMDASGFTLNFTAAQATAYQYISLCLKGVSAKAGSFNKATGAAPAAQAVTGTGFRPSAVLLAGVNRTTQATVQTHAMWTVGAADGTRERTVAQTDVDAANPTQADSLFHNDKIFASVGAGGGATTSALADLASFDASGFTLNWTTNDTNAHEICYLALA